MKVPRLVLLAVLASLSVPALASAQDVAPPGNSAVDQYRESAPPASSGSKKLSASRKRALAKQGRDGAALAAVLEKNGGIPSGGSSGGASSGGGSSSGSRSGGSSSGSGSGSSSSGSAASGGSGREAGDAGSASKSAPTTEKSTSTTDAAASSTVGPLPVWAMLVAAVAIVAVGLVVRRRTSA